MEENLNQKQEPSLKTKRKKAKIAVITLSIVAVLLLGLQVYASTNGYGNVFFMIKNLITTGNPAGEQEIFLDKDITVSYKSIEIAEGTKIQVNRIEIKDGKTKIYISVKSEDGEILPLKYTVEATDKDGKKEEQKEIIGYKPENTTSFSYEDVLTLDYEVKETSTIKMKIVDNTGKYLRTLEINLETREITVTGEAELKKISKIELRKYLDIFALLNDVSGYTQSDNLIEIAAKIQAMEGNGKVITTEREAINERVKQIYGKNAKFETTKDAKGKDVEILKDMRVGTYEKDSDSYDLMEHDRTGVCLKIEDISFENGIYTVKFIYTISTEYKEDKDLEELPQYEATIKLKRDEKNQYSKYQIVSLDKGTEVKNKVSTKVEENNNDDINKEETDFFEENSKLNYTSNLQDSENGKIAVAKSGEDTFKTVQKSGYYIYTDMWNNSYNIKKIKDVKSVFSLIGGDKKSALYRCTIYYIDNNDKDKTFDVAVILSKDNSDGGVIGTFDSYTGSTSFTRWAGIYTESNEQLDTDNYAEEKTAKNLFEKGSKKIRETQYHDYYEYKVASPIVEKTINGVKYQKRNVLYSKVKKQYSEIFTGEALNKVLNKRFAEVDGYLYVSFGGATGWDITNIKVSKISKSNNEIKYKVKYKDVEIDGSTSKELSCNMTIKFVDGNYKISSIDYCNL